MSLDTPREHCDQITVPPRASSQTVVVILRFSHTAPGETEGQRVPHVEGASRAKEGCVRLDPQPGGQRGRLSLQKAPRPHWLPGPV